MSSFAVRLVAPQGGVAFYMNGFLLLTPEESGRASQVADMYLRPGGNSFEMIKRTPLTPGNLQFVDVREGRPDQATILLRSPELNPESPLSHWRGRFEMAPGEAYFAWHRAQTVSDNEAVKRKMYTELQRLQGLLQSGPDATLLRLLSIKHHELGDVTGLGKSQIDKGLIDGLQKIRKLPQFRVKLVAFQEFRAVEVGNGRIYNALNEEGGDALRIIDGAANAGFRVAFAMISDALSIVR